jgi:hypothetical protein
MPKLSSDDLVRSAITVSLFQVRLLCDYIQIFMDGCEKHTEQLLAVVLVVSHELVVFPFDPAFESYWL